MANGDITQQEFICSLTNAEVNERRDNLVHCENDLDYAKERKKEVVAEHSNYVKQFERERGVLLRAINSRSEKRKVDVQEEHRLETNSVVLRRLDNREIVSERPMEAWERQQEMPFDEEVTRGRSKSPGPKLPDLNEDEFKRLKRSPKPQSNGKRKGRPRKQPAVEA
jgi:hypothetical protein